MEIDRRKAVKMRSDEKSMKIDLSLTSKSWCSVLRAGLQRELTVEPPASLSYLKRRLQEDVLVQWKASWHRLAERERGATYNTNVQGDPRI